MTMDNVELENDQPNEFDWSELPDNLNKLLVAQLRSYLGELGLSTEGKKAILVQRLEDARDQALDQDEDPTDELKPTETPANLHGIDEPKSVEKMRVSEMLNLEDKEPEVNDSPTKKTVYCSLCGLHHAFKDIGGNVVLRNLKPVILLSCGNTDPLNLTVPPLIPEQYSDSTAICKKCCVANAAQEVQPEAELKSTHTVSSELFNKENDMGIMKKGPLKRKDLTDSSVPPSPKRPYPGSHPLDINDAIRNSPVHPSFTKNVNKTSPKKLNFD